MDLAACPVSETGAISRTARFDSTGRYRYALGRRWQSGPAVVFVMLNPSQADAERDDPTIRACMQFARCWGCPGVEVVNLFAYRTAHPKHLRQVSDPVGAGCDLALITAAAAASQIVLAWGNWGSLHSRDQAVLSLLSPYAHRLRCLKVNRSGQPSHPLYLRRTTPLLPWPRDCPTQTSGRPRFRAPP